MITSSKISHQKNLRIGRYSQPNQIYHVSFTTTHRSPVFQDFTKARAVISVLKQTDQLQRTQTMAFVIMPDHVHWLMQLIGHHSLQSVIKVVKSKISLKLGHPIWQSGYYDHAIRKDEDIKAVARYIVANPIRAGLANKVGDYPHWDAVWL